MDVEKFLYVRPEADRLIREPLTSFVDHAVEPWTDDCRKALNPPTDPWEREILKAINNLSNTVIQNQASKTLSRYDDLDPNPRCVIDIMIASLRNKPHGRRTFQSVPLFYRALHILGTQRFRLPVRRYVLDLFDIRLDPAVVAAMHEFGQSLPPVESRVEETQDRNATPQIAAPQPSVTTTSSTPEMRQARSPGPPPTGPPVRPNFRSRRNTRIGAVGLGIAVAGVESGNGNYAYSG
ncbi:STE16 protein [Ceratobasidium sp. AG-Ba]|nr:STE16 protein [Ceratobasidium sp. AG-Ba]